MNKSELIEALAQDINVPHREAAAITNTVIDTMTEALARGESIEIRGFGSFVIKNYGSYEGRNPKTGKKIKVKPKKLPRTGKQEPELENPPEIKIFPGHVDNFLPDFCSHNSTNKVIHMSLGDFYI